MHYQGVTAGSPDPLRPLLDQFKRERSAPAMEEIVRRTRPHLLAAARRIGAPQDAEDSVQAAYHALLARPEAPAVAVLPWLLAAVVRIAYRRKALARRDAGLAERLARDHEERSPPEHASRSEIATLVRREVGRLPARYRDPVVLHYLEGLSAGEAARLLDIPESTVRTRLFRARALLQSRLAPALLHALLAVPWFLRDCCQAATGGNSLVLGGTMKTKAWILAGAVAAATGTVG
jgi:RNA polymerase sigma factor (sigma-70 family)